MATRRLIILAAALLFLAAPGFAHPSSTYVVRKGDTLSSISKRFRVPAKKIREENRMRSSRIVTGEKLRIPGKTRPETRAVVRPAAPPEWYTIRRNDTLSGIARKFGMTVEELAEINGLDSDRLVPGRKLALRDREGEDPNPAATALASAAPAPVVTEEELHEAAKPQPAATDNAVESTPDRAIRVAKKLLTTPYVWGGASLTGMDCSGFVWKVFAMLNHNLPRCAREQFRVGREVGKEELSVGDLVFFRTYAKYPSHVGIYLGDNRFIHASSGSRQVKISSLDHPYYVKRYIGAKRLLFHENDVVN